MTAEFDAKQLRPSLTPAEVFGRFFLLGPVFGALVQLLLLNTFLLVAYFGGGPIWIIAGMEISGLIQAFLVFLFGLPASLLVAVCAMASYLVFRRVNVLVVLVAVLAALWIEEYFVPDYYTGYLASHGVRGPWQSGEPNPAPQLAAVLSWVLHFVPAFICFWLVRKERLPPL